MRVLGICVLKGQLRFSVVEGLQSTPQLLHHERLLTNAKDIPSLMNWYEDNFSTIINKYKPNTICYKLILKPNKASQQNVDFAYGVLNLLAFKSNIKVIEFVKKNITPSKLGLEKNIDLYKYCDNVFGLRPPYWDEQIKDSILISLFELPKK